MASGLNKTYSIFPALLLIFGMLLSLTIDSIRELDEVSLTSPIENGLLLSPS